MSTCTTGQMPYAVAWADAPFAKAETPAGACYAWIAGIRTGEPWQLMGHAEGYCLIQYGTSGFHYMAAINKVCEPVVPHWSKESSPFVLSVADGAVISMLVIGVWVMALVARSLVRVVRVPDADT